MQKICLPHWKAFFLGGGIMNKQKGQAMVEFAFIVPFLIFLFLALVYGGILFMDYIQYNNAARAIARDAAFSSKTEFDDGDKETFKKKFNPLTSLYTAELVAVTKDTDNSTVTVKIELNRTKDLKLFGLLTSSSDKVNEEDKVEFPPKHLKPIIYIMPIENVDNDN